MAESPLIPDFLGKGTPGRGLMTRAHLSEVLAETALVAYSAGFLALYLVIKLSHLPILHWLKF